MLLGKLLELQALTEEGIVKPGGANRQTRKYFYDKNKIP